MEHESINKFSRALVCPGVFNKNMGLEVRKIVWVYTNFINVKNFILLFLRCQIEGTEVENHCPIKISYICWHLKEQAR